MTHTLIAVAGLLVLVLLLWIQSYELEYPADVFPRATFAVLAVLGVLIIAAEITGRGSRVRDASAWSSAEFVVHCGITLGATIVYVAFYAVVGFYVTTFLFLTGLFLLPRIDAEARQLGWKKALLLNSTVALGVTVLVYLCFRTLLKVPAPSGFLF